jgi:predicted hydrocarbon binding protein
MQHSHKWIGNLLAALEECADEKTRVRLLEQCGRGCIARSFLQRAQRCAKDARTTDEFLTRLGQIWRHLERKGNRIYVTYPRCYCPIVNAWKGKLPRTWCNCSRGWIKELFESCLGRPVQVELEKSVIAGDATCRFRVRLARRR